MTLPGLALFYAGLVRSKNVLALTTHRGAITPAAGVVCCTSMQILKRSLNIDDSLDVSPEHGIAQQVGVQALGMGASLLWCDDQLNLGTSAINSAIGRI